MAGLLGLLKTILMALAGMALGLGATALVLDPRIGLFQVHAGVWRLSPKAGTSDVDPYTRAQLARTGEIPMGLAEGLKLTAAVDSTGQLLDSQCDYVFSGHIPPARYWTLTLNTPDGQLAGDPAARHGLTSSEILRRADGAFEIAIARNARPGNWLPVSVQGSFLLVLRLYDTAVSATASVVESNTLPEVKRAACP